ALMGRGRGKGEKRAVHAAEAAISSPLMDGSVEGARHLLVNITHGPDFGIGEFEDAMNRLNLLVDPETGNVVSGTVLDPDMGDEVEITVIATGMGEFKPRGLDEKVFGASTARTRNREQAGVGRRPSEVREPVEKPMDIEDLPIFLRSR
ncbi:MAG: hypothetical protein MH204_01055, partial [Fimbriimonadaceae bacterium]|nr:hypothetical protein [Fimbriimonadaceae bacterium]